MTAASCGQKKSSNWQRSGVYLRNAYLVDECMRHDDARNAPRVDETELLIPISRSIVSKI